MLLPETPDFDGPFPRLSRPLRLGIVGGGRIAQTQAMAARMTGRWDIVAGALSRNPAQAKARGMDYFLPEDRCYASFADMAVAEAARPDGVDAVMITTPNNVHHAAACAFLDAGIDVLCDKPLTNEAAEADDLVTRTTAAGVAFGVGYVMSCFPMVRQAREMVRAGAIGQITQIHAEFLQDWMVADGFADAPHAKWRLDPAQSGPTSTTGDIGTHAAHLAEFVSGLKMTDLRADMHVCAVPKPLEDTVLMTTRYGGDVPGTLMATRMAPGNRGGLRLRIFGTDGGLEWDLEDCERLKHGRVNQPDQIFTRGPGGGLAPPVARLVRTGRGFPEGLIEAWANLYTEFAMAVAARRDGVTPPANWLGHPTVADGARGVYFIHAAVRSHEKGGVWVQMP